MPFVWVLVAGLVLAGCGVQVSTLEKSAPAPVQNSPGEPPGSEISIDSTDGSTTHPNPANGVLCTMRRTDQLVISASATVRKARFQGIVTTQNGETGASFTFGYDYTRQDAQRTQAFRVEFRSNQLLINGIGMSGTRPYRSLSLRYEVFVDETATTASEVCSMQVTAAE